MLRSVEEGSTVMTESPSRPLHLPSLSIREFRGIRALEIPRLGRVTLLAGKNGAGKTTALEAVRLYASRGHEEMLSTLSSSHDEVVSAVDEDGDEMSASDFAALFHGRDVSLNSRIEIGPVGGSGDDNLKIEAVIPSEKQAARLEGLFPNSPSDAPLLVMQVTFANHKRTMPWFIPRRIHVRSRRIYTLYRRLIDERSSPREELNCQALGPGLPNASEIAKLWDEIALTEDENHAIRALNLVLHNKANRVAVVGEDHGPYGLREQKRRVVVKLQDRDKPVPLRSLGDGATRMLGVALALAGSRGGFLVIDEVENGFHHSVHEDFWRMVLRTAEKEDIQVFAATHSLDCVRGFGRAAADSESEAILARLERRDEHTCAVLYSKQEIETAADQGIEVR